MARQRRPVRGQEFVAQDPGEALDALRVSITNPYAAGVIDQRRADPTAGRGADAEHRPVLIRNREQTGEGFFKTFARNAAQYLGAETGIQTKRQREDYELLQAEAGQAYEQRLMDERALVDNFDEQIGADALRLESYNNAGLDERAANLRRDTAEALYQYRNFRDPEMRAAALGRLQELQASANEALDSHVNEGLKEARVFFREEMKDLRRSFDEVQGAYSERKASEAAMLERLALIGSGEVDEDSAEGQTILREALGQAGRHTSLLGTALRGAGNLSTGVPVLEGIAQGLGALVAAEESKLSYSDTLKAYTATARALDRFSYGDGEAPGFIPQLEQQITQRESFGRDTLGIPIDDSWRKTRFLFQNNRRLPANAPRGTAVETGTRAVGNALAEGQVDPRSLRR